jgi:uncharacterized protein
VRAVPSGAGPELAAGAAVLSYSVALNTVIPKSLHTPANLAAAGLLTAYAVKMGARGMALGSTPDSIGEGMRLGWKVALPVAAVVLAGIAIPSTRELFTGDESMNMPPGDAAFDSVVRIPLGTVVPEELIFRGALMALLLRRHGPWKAAAISSVLFGIWHVLPTLDSLQSHSAGDVADTYAFGHGLAALGTVGLTAAAGMGFSWLRLRSGSVVAPMLVHLATNETATLGGRAAKKVLHLARMRKGILGTI